MDHAIILILSVGIPLLLGFACGMFTYAEIPKWYTKLNKPKWNPPSWIFGPLWTILYILMGISLYIVWTANVEETVRKPAMVLFFLQLGLNFFWTFIFFNWHQIGIALAEIITLWILILITIISFASVSSFAAWLLAPYIVWVSFASILNYGIWKLNK